MRVRIRTIAAMERVEKRRLEWWLLMLALLATSAFCVASGSWYYFIVNAVAVAVNLYFLRKNREVYASRLTLNTCIIAAMCIVFWEFHRGRNVPIVILGHFVVLLQLYKLFEKKRLRDYAQLLLLSLLQVIVTASICADLWFLPVLLTALVLASHAAVVFSLCSGLGATTTRFGEDRQSMLPGRPASKRVIRRWPGGLLRRTLVQVVFPLIGVATVAFMFIPRISARAVATSGFGGDGDYLAEEIRLGYRDRIYTSDAIAMEVGVSTGGSRGRAPGVVSRYLRCYALDYYGNSGWRRSVRNARTAPDHSAAPAVPAAIARSVVVHEIELRNGRARVIPAPVTTFSLSCPKGKTINRTSRNEYTQPEYFSDAAPWAYTTRSLPPPLSRSEREFVFGVLGDGAPATIASVEIAPETRNRIVALGRRWCADLLVEREQSRQFSSTWDWINVKIARRVAEHLRAGYRYTLDLSESDPRRDGVEDFLFHMKKGHCEYFASAMAVMCTLLNVPCRVATGYVMQEYEPGEQVYVVRASDAHAWCEIYTPRFGWMLIDPTSPVHVAEREGSGFMNTIRDFLLGRRFRWYRAIVDYSDRDRQLLGKTLSGFFDGIWDRVAGFFDAVWNTVDRLFRSGSIYFVIIPIVVFTAAAILALLASHLRWPVLRRLWPRRNGDRRLADLDRLLARLERRGLTFHPGDTLRRRVLLAVEMFELPAAEMERLVQLRYRWRWGHATPMRAEQAEAERIIDGLRKRLR